MIATSKMKKIMAKAEEIMLNKDYYFDMGLMIDKSILPFNPGNRKEYELIGVKKNTIFSEKEDLSGIISRAKSKESSVFLITDWLRKDFRGLQRLFRSEKEEFFIPEYIVENLNIEKLNSGWSNDKPMPAWTDSEHVFIMPVHPESFTD